MTIASQLHRAAVWKCSFPATSYVYNRRHIARTYAMLRKSEHLPREALRKIQLVRLRKVIEHAYTAIPFYTKRFKEIGLEPGDITRIEDIKIIPPLNREEVIDYARQMIDVKFEKAVTEAERIMAPPGQPIPFGNFRRHRLVRNTSSGSTGAPTVFYEDGSVSALNWAHDFRLRSWFGIAPAEKEARMIRISPDYVPRAAVNVWRKLLWNQCILPGVNLGEENYAYCAHVLAQFRPAVIWGFTSALVGLAEYLQSKGQSYPEWTPRLLIGWAAPLHEHERKTLAEAFDCPSTNVYGSREVGHVAGKCPEGRFHLNDEYLLVEAEENADYVEDSASGELLVTSLLPGPMPFIRYRMGDIGAISSDSCPCGRTLRILSELLGRTGEIFITKNGRMISPNFWCRTFMDPKTNYAVRRFQVIYTHSKDLRIRIVRSANYTQDTETYLRRVLERNFNHDTRIDFEYPQDIAPLISGKYQMVVNESKQNR